MAILHALDHSIKSLEVFPNEVTNSGILRNCFVCAVVGDVVSRGTADRYVVYEGNGGVGDFGLKDICDIVMEDRYRICPTHRKGDKLHCAEGRLEHS
jgi:hypothetical protein